jgi:hypothetical protein
LQGRSVFPVTVRLYHDLHILIEGHQEAQKALNGKLPELTAQHLRDIGLADSEQLSGLDLFRPRSFMIVSILNTSCALTKCSSAFGTPMSLKTFLLPVSYRFLLLMASSPW